MKLLTTSLCAFLIAGCAVLGGPDYYRNHSTAELCRQLLTLPSYNVNHPARQAELTRRGESCGSHADVAAAQRAADQQYQQTIQALQPPPPARPVNCTTTYVGNQAYTTCR